MPTTRVDETDRDVLSVRISDIPALVHFFDVEQEWDGEWRFAWEVHDRRGYPAEWLERKLTSREVQDIEQQILDKLAWAERERRERRRATRKGMEDEL